jgi:uncharacterized membrane protein
VRLIQLLADLVFTTAFIACADYLTFMFNCSYDNLSAPMHHVFEDVSERPAAGCRSLDAR